MAGRKSLKEEIKIVERMSELSEPVFKFIKGMYEVGEKDDKKWASEQMMKLYAKAVPTEVGSDPERPILFVPSELMGKYGINSSTSDNSQGQAQISSSELRKEVREDDTSSGGDKGSSGVETQQDQLHSTNVSAS